jgi:hypothetical protein
MSLRVCMFQLSESNNLDRITNVLQNLWTYSRDNLFKLTKKYELDIKLVKIIQKYCNGDYGFDLNTSKSGLFQLNYLKAISKTFSWEVLIERLANSDFYELYGQLIEEALIFAYDYTFKAPAPTNCQVFSFLASCLSPFGLLLSHKFVPFLGTVHSMLTKLEERVQKVALHGESSR